MPERPRCILIFGGTFDPPHAAHATLPPLAARLLSCDEILYVPAKINPLKVGRDAPPAPPNHRVAMLLLTIADIPNARISTIELDREGPSYTIDTLRSLRAQYGEENGPEFRLLLGADQALEFHRWKDWQEILKLATPAVMLRPPWTRETFQEQLRARYCEDEANRWMSWTLPLPMMDLSATDIRRRLSRGEYESLRDALAPAVLEYIRANKLYL